MNLLIVDDEQLFIDDILSSVDWDKLGILSVFTALNIRAAKATLENHPIDIALCDIEMPQGNGLELISWIKERFPKIESIILTCHIDFSYAQQAIKAGCLDYILKPFQNEALEDALQKAIYRINHNNHLQEYSKLGEYWRKYHSVISEKFWLDLIQREIGANPEWIEKEARNRNIQYNNEAKYFPVLFSVKKWDNDYSPYDRKVMAYGLRNVTFEILLSDCNDGQVLELSDNQYLVLFPMQTNRPTDIGFLKDRCGECVLSCHQHLECDLACYIGDSSHPCDLPDRVDQLLLLDKDNVCIMNQVVLQNETICSGPGTKLYSLTPWSLMLADGKSEKVITEISKYLNDLNTKRCLNANLLKRFLHDYMQMIYNLLEKSGISAHQIMDDKSSIELYDKAPLSIANFIQWIQYISNLTVELIDTDRNSDSTAEKIKNYIDMNFNQDATREFLSEKFFLNADYIDRIFKKRFGCTITKYVWNQRIIVAKQLLLQTDTSISEIAVSLGFANFSHFSSMFKKATNLSPTDYRRISCKS